MSLEIQPLGIEGVLLVTPKRFGDHRGFFSETYNEKKWREAGIDTAFCQDNHSLSAERGTLRGLHYQAPPYAQTKLVRCIRGSILDVAVDARKSSPTYGRSVAAVLSAENGVQILVPKGFLHGFLTLEPDTEVTYKVDAYYDAASDGSVYWNDPDLNIRWEGLEGEPHLSEKDANAPRFADWDSPFA